MHAHRTFAMLALLLLLTCSVAYAGDDGKADGASYASMLGYLDNSRIGGQAFQGVSGATAINLSAGTLNQQSNLRAFAVGATAQTMIRVRQLQRGDVTVAPLDASARIGDHAFENGRGIVSINQASGNGNAEFNAVSTALASPGIREATDSSLSASVSASAGGQPPANPGSTSPKGSRSVAVESSAMHGFRGLLQLNQIAGSGNATSNSLLLSATSAPR